MSNIINAIIQLVENPKFELRKYSESHNRANNMGEALEEYIKDIFAGTVNETDENTGLFGKSAIANRGVKYFEYMAGTFHYMFNLEYARMPLKYPEKLIDICLWMYENIDNGELGEDFLNKIEGMSSFYSKNNIYNKYICLFSNIKETLGIMFDNSGKVIKRSSMIFDEEDEVNQEVINEEVINIDFIEKNKKKINLMSRVYNDKKEFLIKYINGLNDKDDLYILKYIYYDCFELEVNCIDTIRNDILKIINNDENLDKLYDLVNLLKKIKN